MGIASGTALTMTALPLPAPIRIQVDKYLNKSRVKKQRNNYDTEFRDIEKKSWVRLLEHLRMPVLRLGALSPDSRPRKTLLEARTALVR